MAPKTFLSGSIFDADTHFWITPAL